MSHVINRALTGEKPCIIKAIHALLMHGYATFNMIVPGPQICCRYQMCTARPWNEHSPWKLCSWDIGEKAKQNSARLTRNVASVFSFYAITPAFQHLPWDLANVNAWKPCLIPILINRGQVTWKTCKFRSIFSILNTKCWRPLTDLFIWWLL